jgi:hypothetical protein
MTDPDAAYFAEIEGRKKRANRFRVRGVRGFEVMEDDPRRYMLEISAGNTGHLNAMTEADLKALYHVVGLMVHGQAMPIEG